MVYRLQNQLKKRQNARLSTEYARFLNKMQYFIRKGKILATV
ncbi:hypothetical protein SORDD21_01762 [Streptococcus oralis]|uniref:Uncharacterized protein n=1 Tax=Streptococcus oralis TaxID=1303 RepID=A0A139PH04_STROR|nr:hypothetical protein SORDD21_01762 [Streptococcus oralis]